MVTLLRLSRLIDAAADRLGAAVSWLVLVMVAVGSWNAVARWGGRLLGASLSGNALIEAQWYLFALVFLLGAAWTLRQDRHVRVDVLFGHLPARARAWIDLGGTLLFLLPACAFALWASWPPVRASFAIREGSPDPGGLPRWPIKAAILACFGLLALQGISEAIKRVARLRGDLPDEAPPPAAEVAA